MLTWRPDAVEIGEVRCPVLSIGGGASGPWFTEAREVLKRWLPHVEEATIEGGDHLVAATHPEELAALISDFVRCHPCHH